MSAQVIGYLGENGVRDVRIPIGHLLDKWQGLRPLLVMVPVGGSDDEAYPVQYTLDGTDLVWHVSDADTAVAGTTKAAVRMVDDGGRVGMDEPFQVIISPNLSAGGNPPLVIKPWVDKLATLVPRAEAAAERAENATERAENATERAENAAERVETGTAPNALALGGKPPSYYLPVVRLLDNSDFAIAQAGYPVWDATNQKWTSGLHGSELYASDRWRAASVADGFTINRINGITSIRNTKSQICIIEQPLSDYAIKHIKDGTKYTIAICLSDNTIKVINDTYRYSAEKDYDGLEIYTGGGFCVDLFCFVGARPSVRIFAIDIASLDFKWIDIYPDTYSKDNLPPHVPPDPAVDLMKSKYRYQKYRFAPWAAMGSGFSSNVTMAYLMFPLETPIADDVNISLMMTGNILYRVNGKTYNIDASTGTVINHTNMLLIQFPGLSIDSSDLNSAGFFINGGTSYLTVEISADQ